MLSEYPKRGKPDAKEGEKSIKVAGKLEGAYDFWKNVLKASKFILSIIAFGYALPFARDCPPFYAKKQRF